MEGLEIAIVNLSDLRNDTRDLRIDSQFFSKSAIIANGRITSRAHTYLSEITTSIRSFGAYSLTNQVAYLGEGIPFIRCVNIRHGLTDFSDVLFIDETSNALLHKSEVRPGMVLMTMSGSVGRCSVALPEWKYPINSNQDIAKITLSKGHDPLFLSAYLNSNFGQALLQRFPCGSVQQHIFLWQIEEIPVPSFSVSLTKRISSAVRKSHDFNAESKTCHQQAELSLLSALGLDVWQTPDPLTYEASAQSAFLSGRLDAEFFRPKFKALEEKLKETGSAVRLGDVASLIGRGGQPIYADEGLPVINSKHVNYGRVVSNDDNRRGEADGKSLRIQQGDVLINGTGVGTIGRSAPYLDEQDALPDNHVTIVRAKEGAIDPVYLAVFLNSQAGQMQVDKWFKGSSGQIELYPDDISNFWVWVAPPETQKSIRDQVTQSRVALGNSKSLLERAKRAVEIAVEVSEETALAYLDGKHYLADELLPKLFGPNRHYVDLPTVQRTIEAEALVYEDATINRYLHEWTRQGRIHDAGRGWYSDLRHPYQPNWQTPPLPELEKRLGTRFPLMEYTVWSTRQFTPFFHQYAARHATFLMVDRDAMASVADALMEAGHHVVIHPLGDAAKNFALTRDETIILRPRLSSDHKETHAPLEQMLVDFHHEIQKLGFFELGEFQRVFENVANFHRLNIPALKRYAERRKADSTELLKLGGIL